MAMEWQKRASCDGLPIDEFYAEKVKNVVRRICHDCPVQPECLAFAMKTESQWSRFGVWGGLSARERYALAASGGDA